MTITPTSYPSALPQHLPGFEVEATIERLMGNEALWWRVLEMFLTRFGDWDQAWLLSQSETETERKCVHGLRSVAVNIGAVELAASTTALEKALVDSDHTPAMLAHLRAQLLNCFREASDVAAAALAGKFSRTHAR